MVITPDPIGLLGLLLLLAKGGGFGRSAPSAPAPAAPAPTLPQGQVSTSPGWPQVMPAGLPVFPGSGWEYDEPPPVAVQKRAAALVSTLWAKGAGAFKTELVGGRWITFRAEKVRSGKNGVVAYRQRIAKAPKPAETTQAPAAQQPAAIPVSSSSARQSVMVKNGHTYRWRMSITGFDDVSAIATALQSLNATKIHLQKGPPIVAEFELAALASKQIYLHEPTGFPIGGKLRTVTFLEIVEVLPEGVLTSASAPAPGAAQAPGEPLALRELKIGDGLAPAEPLEEVKIVQRRLQLQPVDGRFGTNTRDAVIKFQVETGLAPKGVKLEELRARGFGAVKRATWEKLFAVRA